MRVGITAEFLGFRHNGLATYQRELLRGLAQLSDGPHHFYPYIATPAARQLVPVAAQLTPRLVPPYNAALRLYITLPAELMRRPVDVLHVAGLWGPPWSPCPTVASIHDLGWENVPDIYPPLRRWRLSLMVRMTAHHATRIIAPSHYTAADLQRIYKVPPDKIRVIYPGFDAERLAAGATPAEAARVRRHYGLDGPFLLYVGSIEPKKNVDKLIRAYATLRRECGIPHKLVIAGKPLWLAQQTLDLPRVLGVEPEVRFLGQVPDADLPGLYTAATVSAYLGSYEGFGFPPLEAMACGAPSLVANRTSLPEVVGDAARLVDPLAPEQVVRGLYDLLSSDALRAELSARGRARASQFPATDLARHVIAVYEESLATAHPARGSSRTRLSPRRSR
jgi:glycosyltransferase involved in cell wall biosynthesis